MKGIVLGDRYELQEKIGEGGMSEVFKARCNKLNRFVAVKILKKEFCNNEDIVQKFKGEATAIAMLNDNNIVNILDVGTQDEINYIVMEYVKGKTLKDVIKQVGKMNYETGISVAIQIAKALDCAHRNQIIHRDVKPQNILVTEDGIMKVTDFGIAKSASSSTITNTSTIMGSAHYLSPEQAKGSFIDCRTDLYSLGVVIYEMVTGVVPFEGDSAVTIALKHIQKEVVPPKQINSRIPDSLNKLILKAMEKNPNKRYQTAKEMIADLQKIKENPNARIGDDDIDDGEHTIIMSAVSDDMETNKGSQGKKDNSKKDYDDEDDDDYYYDYDDDDDDYDDDYDDKEKSKSKKSIAKIVIAVLCVAILGTAAVFGATKLLGSSSAVYVTVPDLKGMTVEEAKAELDALNLVLTEAGSEESSEYEKGTIVSHNPESGSKVEENSEIRVIVSDGEVTDTMPDLEGRDLSSAKTILKSVGLEISETNEEYSDDVAAGKIIDQEPKKGSSIDDDTEVIVTISKGPQVTKNQVPNVVNLSSDEAQANIEALGFNVIVQTQTVTDSSKNGVVINQSVTPGTQLTTGKTITITVGKYVETQSSTQDSNNSTTTPNTNSGTSSGTTNGTGSGTSDGNTTTEEPSDDTDTSNPEGPWEDTDTSGGTTGGTSNETGSTETNR